MTRFISELAAGLEPYVPGEQPKDKKYVKLNTNENPYPPSDKVIEAVGRAAADLRLYPDPDSDMVRNAAADYFNDVLKLEGEYALDKENIFAGNGSDEVLSLLCPAFFTGKKIVFPDITYSFYPAFCSLFQVPYTVIPLAEDFSIDINDYINGFDEETGGIFLCNPNAPTGRALPVGDIETVLKANRDILVIVDEAYVDFGAETAAGLVKKYDNLLVVQTLSKSRQLAGMRVGIAIGNSELIQAVNTVKNTYNSYPVDRLAIAAAKAAFEDREYFDRTRSLIAETRDNTIAALQEMGFDIIPSSSNFIFARPPKVKAHDMFLALRERGVLVRYFNKPRIDDRMRITIGTPEEMEILISNVREILDKA